MLEMIDIKTGLILIGVLASIALFRWFFMRKSSELLELEKEYEEVLKLDKYKVKGQW
ncbi:MAG: hypothetical protein WC595_00615 [Candidatus Nanoarchaeia archaeon]